MSITYTQDMETLGALLKMLGVPYKAWRYNFDADGSTYVRDILNGKFPNSTRVQDQGETDFKTAIDASLLPNLVSSHAAMQEEFRSKGLQKWLGIGLLLMDEDEAALEDGIDYVYDDALLGRTGQVQISQRVGPWARLRADMIDNSKTVQKPSSLSAASIAAVTGNVGSLAEASVTILDHTLAGIINFECVDDTIGATKIAVSLAFTLPLINGALKRDADNPATLGKSFEDGPTGLTITLGYGTLVESGDGGNMFASTAVATPSENDTDKGKIFIRVVRMSGSGGNPDFMIEWYNSSSMEEDELIATYPVSGTSGTVAVTMEGEDTVLTTTFSKTNAASALASVNDEDTDIIFDIDNPRIGDRWTKAITNNESGNFNSKIARRFPFSLPSASSPNISDTYAADIY